MHPFAPRPRKPFVGLALAAMGGIVVGDLAAVPVLWLAILAGIAAAFVLWRPRRSGVWVLTGLAFALIHTCRHGQDPARHFAGVIPASGMTGDLEGIVWSEPTVFAGGRGQARAIFRARVERLEAPNAPRSGICLVRWVGDSPKYGDRIRVSGVVRRPDPARNPGEFDGAGWLARQGVFFEVAGDEAKDCVVVGEGEGNAVMRFAIASRQWIKTCLDRGLPEDAEISTLISSMVLGMRGETPVELKEVFQKTGTLHLFAVSGLNVAMLAVIAWYLLKPFQLGRKRAVLIIVPMLAGYAVIVGMSASCVRATIMAVFILLAPLVEREAVTLNSLAAAAFAILAWDTNECFDPGFQLSFVLVMAILAFAGWLQERFQQPMLPDEFVPRRLWSSRQKVQAMLARSLAGLGGMGLACWGGSVLFTAGYFHLVSPVGLLANLVAVPIAFFVLALGLLSLLLSAAALPAAAVLANHANWLCAKALILAVQAFASVPMGHIYVEWPTVRRAPVFELVVLGVGEGAAIHLRAGGEDLLIDAGHQRNYERVVLPYLRSRGVDELDGLLITHGDTSHVGGAISLLRDFSPRWVGDSVFLDRSRVRRALHAELAAANRGRRFYQRGDRIEAGNGVGLEVLYPPGDWPRALADDKGLVLRLRAGARRILLVGDVGFAVEQWLLKNEADLGADVLVKGWPNRDLSGTPDFINAIGPQAIVCAEPKFGSGSAELAAWADPLRERGILVLNQAQSGAVRIRMQTGGELEVAAWRR